VEWKKEIRVFIGLSSVFLLFYFLPVGVPRFNNAVLSAMDLAKSYAREHVLLCLLPALYIAGAVSVFLRQESVMKHLGPDSNKLVAYGVASVAGTILAVCSCTVLPLFAGIYMMGAGLGPATAFLYSGPAINILAIVMTARILGPGIGFGRAAGAILLSVVIGLIMHLLFKKQEAARRSINRVAADGDGEARPLWKTAIYFASMIGVLVFANWGRPEFQEGIWFEIYSAKWLVTSAFAILLLATLVAWFGLKRWKAIAIAAPVAALAIALPHTPIAAFTAGLVGLSVFTAADRGELGDWFSSSWGYTKQILPLLLGGVLVAGAVFGVSGHEGLVPAEWINNAVGGNGFLANLLASVVGALMYFATLTEVPIVQGLVKAGMGPGPALALLLAGPALSLPSMLVIRGILGTRKAAAYIGLVVVMATASGFIYGLIAG
jgi:uncharacterized membrane protein YraQ (UPF0718 family)